MFRTGFLNLIFIHLVISVVITIYFCSLDFGDMKSLNLRSEFSKYELLKVCF